MKYRDQSDARKGQTVLGFTKSGQPVAGEVLDLNPNLDKVLISPMIQNPTWVPAEDCVRISREILLHPPPPQPAAPGAKPLEAPEGAANAPEGQQQSTGGSQSAPETSPGEPPAKTE